ncbi:hypothetical protein ACJX0J_038239, partial [Zea mays]
MTFGPKKIPVKFGLKKGVVIGTFGIRKKNLLLTRAVQLTKKKHEAEILENQAVVTVTHIGKYIVDHNADIGTDVRSRLAQILLALIADYLFI